MLSANLHIAVILTCLSFAGGFSIRSAAELAHIRAGSSQRLTRHQLRKGNDKKDSLPVPKATHSGYLGVSDVTGSRMFHAFFEARQPLQAVDYTPIILWLQGGPGCSSLFGMLYINGPYFVNSNLSLRVNHGSWNRLYGMLFIEQPIGVGFSVTGNARIPDNELDVGFDLYRALQSFYRAHPSYAQRPLIITGESYAGKYVPSAAHFILQADAMHHGYMDQLRHARDFGSREVEAPEFMLGGIAIGNGFTDAEAQTKVQALVAWSMGLIDWAQRQQAEQLQARIVDLVQSRMWREARDLSDELLAFITNCSSSATLEDIRRNTAYDSVYAADQFLNQRHVQAALGAPDMAWEGCSREVDRVLGPDVMRSVRNLVEDLLGFIPVLLYQGQFDAECGVASNDVWISNMRWEGHLAWSKAERRLWHVNGRVAGYLKHSDNLTRLIVRNTGHMMPHDNPLYGQLMLERWVEEEVLGRRYDRNVTPQMERDYANADQGDQSV